MSEFFAEKTVLVTGASRGIGHAIAAEFARRGAYVLGTATSEKGAADIAHYLAAHHYRGAGLILDVSDNDSVLTFSENLETGDAPDILVNNAGITRDNLLMRMRDDEWEAVINTNLNGLYRITKLCLKPMLKARFGRIINIASVVGLSGNPGQTNYAATKSGMIGFTKSLAREVGRRGITVNAVAPGLIETDMTARLDKKARDALLQQITLGRLGRPDEVAKVAGFLASDAAGYITGQTISVNGGMYMT